MTSERQPEVVTDHQYPLSNTQLAQPYAVRKTSSQSAFQVVFPSSIFNTRVDNFFLILVYAVVSRVVVAYVIQLHPYPVSFN